MYTFDPACKSTAKSTAYPLNGMVFEAVNVSPVTGTEDKEYQVYVGKIFNRQIGHNKDS